MRKIYNSLAPMDLIKFISSKICGSVNVPEDVIFSILLPHVNRLIIMDSAAINRLVGYIISIYDASPHHIGTCYAQMLLHGVTQLSLSGKVISNNLYLPVMDVLELKSTSSCCRIIGDYDKLLRIEHITMKDIITGINTSSRPRWMSYSKDILDIDNMYDNGVVVGLNKEIMGKHRITMKHVASCIREQYQDIKEINYSPNYAAELYTSNYYRGSIANTIANIDEITLSGAPGFKILRHSDNISYCHYSHLRLLKDYGFKVKCNDIRTVYDVLGPNRCRKLIIKSLMSNNSITRQCAELICCYMMRSGQPLPFDKNAVKGTYGALFDMYYAKPVDSIISWVLDDTEDRCITPYTRLMVGSKNIL